MINVPAQRTMLMMLATTPVTWASGTAAIERSADVSFMQASYTVAEWMTLQCASIAPLGRPVVPDVYKIMAVSSSPTAAGGCAAALSVRSENCDALSLSSTETRDFRPGIALASGSR